MNPWLKIAGLSHVQRQAYQNKKLEQFINTHLYPFSPYYQNLFHKHKINPKHIRSVQDLKNIPFTSKLEFLDQEGENERFKEFILHPDKAKIRTHWPINKLAALTFTKVVRGSKHLEEKLAQEYKSVFMTFTTGTTNNPIPFMYSNYDIKNLHVSGARMLNLFHVDSNQTIVNAFPYAPHLAFWQVVFAGFPMCCLILSTGGGKTIGTEGNIRAILKMKPSVILGVPSYIYHIFRSAKDAGCKMEFVKKVVLGASRITQSFKQKLAELVESMGAKDVSVFGTYGFTEARSVWAECPTALDVSSGYHLYADKEIFEVIDPNTGEVKGEGEDGELVYTSIDSRASSVLRYRTGDFVKGGIVHDNCPYCQRQVSRISSDITRLSDVKDLQLSKIKGTLVNLNDFEAILSEIEHIDEWQIAIKKKNNDPFEIDELVIYVCVKGHCDKEQLCEEVRKKVLLATEVSPNSIELIELGTMINRLELETANKAKRIIDLRPKT